MKITSEFGPAPFFGFSPSAEAPGVVYLEVSRDIEAELWSELLRADAALLEDRASLQIARVPDYVVVALAAAPGAWLALRTAIRAVADRHKHKTFHVELPGGGAISADGQSAQDVTRLLETAQTLFEREAQARITDIDRHYAALAHAAQQLLANRDGLSVDESVTNYLDATAEALVDWAAGSRQRSWLSWCLSNSVMSLWALQLRSSSPAATTEEARQALTAAAEALANPPADPFFNPFGL
ncbi:hypothetical protein ACWIID_33105 [Streptomyces phaeochromogenes]